VRWPIRNQILIPFAATLAVAVGTIAVTASWLAARREERETVDRLRRVVETLGQSNFPHTSNVLLQMRGLSGAEFVAFDSQGRALASTLPESETTAAATPAVPLVRDVDSLGRDQAIEIAGERHLAARVRAAGAGSLLVLYPERRWADARRDAAWPPLAVGAVTIVVMLALSAWLARRVGRRIDAVRGLFARIADGSFEQATAEPPNDELHDLVLSANRLSDRLREMRETIRRTERVRLLGQLAGGLAHQLRNSLTGARMAVQLHQRRCRPEGDDGLDVALIQLALTEEQVKGLLALGRRDDGPTRRGAVPDLLREVERLVGPACRHGKVRWTCSVADDANDILLDGYDRVRAALLNLTLNAIEAAGPNGDVRLVTESDGDTFRIEVRDGGPGPSAAVRDSLFDPFMTTKPEGVGLGLALARQTASDLGGSLSWARAEGATVFTFTLPVAARVVPAAAPIPAGV
jgi:signal transduction histidine kinase